MAGDGQRPVVIRKVVKKADHAHHGGSWKVAYADFVTAMMAFFLVMWILGMDPKMRQSIESYFQGNVAGVKQGYAGGASPLSLRGGSPGLHLVGRAGERRRFEAAGQRIRTRLEAAGLGRVDAEVQVTVTDQGLRIELIEGSDGVTFFPFGSPVLQPAARRALAIIAAEIGPLARRVAIEGHTDAARYASPGYTNWELSVDRANAARKALVESGLDPAAVLEVRGFADRQLRVPDQPLDPSNRRISIFLPFDELPPPEVSPAELAPRARADSAAVS